MSEPRPHPGQWYASILHRKGQSITRQFLTSRAEIDHEWSAVKARCIKGQWREEQPKSRALASWLGCTLLCRHDESEVYAIELWHESFRTAQAANV